MSLLFENFSILHLILNVSNRIIWENYLLLYKLLINLSIFVISYSLFNSFKSFFLFFFYENIYRKLQYYIEQDLKILIIKYN